jgi:2-polyprenyl-3-methyl-5-hydroxy-6-metoxy-1,4-benzoquinol methylase
METKISDFYIFYIDQLFEDPVFRKQLLTYQFVARDNTLSDKEYFKKVLRSHLEEATLTLSIINDIPFTKKDSLLEIGSGMGLVYGYLKKQGYDIYGIEPCDSGFDGYFAAAQQLFKIIGVDGSHCYPYVAKETEKLNKQFDIIFSNNVLEHIPELEESISSLRKILKPAGMMVHNTVNYYIPYEPHFKMVLFPFFPRLTEQFKPSLKTSPLWNGLNFITTTKLRSICSSNDLNIEFKKDRLLKTFRRLDEDQGFAKRQKYFVPIYQFLKLTGTIRFLNKIPSALTTPITFIITNDSSK